MKCEPQISDICLTNAFSKYEIHIMNNLHEYYSNQWNSILATPFIVIDSLELSKFNWRAGWLAIFEEEYYAILFRLALPVDGVISVRVCVGVCTHTIIKTPFWQPSVVVINLLCALYNFRPNLMYINEQCSITYCTIMANNWF